MKKNLDLSLLKYADSSAIERIADHTPSASVRNMERIFQTSEKKYQYRFLTPEQAFDSETWEAEPIKKSGILFHTASAAACFVVCAGTVGGIYLLNQNRPVQDLQTAEVIETESSVSESETTAEQSAQIMTETVKSTTAKMTETVIRSTETQKAVTPETTTVISETESQTTQTKTITTETVSAIQTEAPETEFVTETIAEIIPETVQILENQTQVIIPETETSAPETQPITEPVTEIQLETEPEEETPFPGFRIESEGVVNPDNGIVDYWDKIYPASLENAAKNYDVLYAPTWLPDGWTFEEISTGDELLDQMRQANKEFMEQEIRNGTTTAYETSYLPVDENGNFRQAGNIEFYQYLKTDDYFFGIGYTDINYGHFTPFTVNGKNGLLVTWHDEDENDERQRTFSIIWDNGDYVFMVQTFSNTFAEAVRVAESVQPVG